MNSKPIEAARDPLLVRVLPALERAAVQARKLAQQTGTAVIVYEQGQIKRITFEVTAADIAELVEVYKTGKHE